MTIRTPRARKTWIAIAAGQQGIIITTGEVRDKIICQVQSYSKYWWSIYYVESTVLMTGDIVMNTLILPTVEFREMKKI